MLYLPEPLQGRAWKPPPARRSHRRSATATPRPAGLYRATLALALLVTLATAPAALASSARAAPLPAGLVAAIERTTGLSATTTPASEFGYAVALSANGKTALIGGPHDDDGDGAAWFFTRSRSGWVEQGPKLTGDGEPMPGGNFGLSVALSADGDTALIGGPGNDGDVGAAWVFTHGASGWTPSGTPLIGPNLSSSARFGWSVALSASGDTALIGSPSANAARGAAWIFVRSGSTWVREAKPLSGAGIAAGSAFGASVALSGDGTTALVGGPYDRHDVGAAWIFRRHGSTWREDGGLLRGAGESGSGGFGWSAALSADGDTALIGGVADDGGRGAAWVFARAGPRWSEQGVKLTGSGETQVGAFGTAVALSADGDTAIVGGSADDHAHGAAWTFTRSGSSWSGQVDVLSGEGESKGSGYFGAAVALSASGAAALVGGPGDSSENGAAWAFAQTSSGWLAGGAKLTGSDALAQAPTPFRAQGPALTGSDELGAKPGQVSLLFGSSVALSADGDTALVGDADDDPGLAYGRGAVWVFVRSGSTWRQQGPKLSASGERDVSYEGHDLGGGSFGTSVALSADGDTALIGGASDDSFVGAAWVFTRSDGRWRQQGPPLVGAGSKRGNDFGASVALSADGTTALVGGNPGGGGPYRVKHGAAWVFTRVGSGWREQGPPLGGGAGFGTDVALSADGNTALVGAVGRTKGGSATAFTRADGTWTRLGKPLSVAGEETETGHWFFGTGVALSADGDTALVAGAIEPNPALATSGLTAGWVFERSGSGWRQVGPTLLARGNAAGPASFSGQDSAVLSADGTTAVITGFGQLDGRCATVNCGGAYVFARTRGGWVQQGGELSAGAGGLRGLNTVAVALSADGSTLLLGGGVAEPQGEELPGHVWAFTEAVPHPLPTWAFALLAALGAVLLVALGFSGRRLWDRLGRL